MFQVQATVWQRATMFCAALLLVACQRTETAHPANATVPNDRASTSNQTKANQAKAKWVAVGKKIFFDNHLSASGSLSCASCHDPSNAYAPANALPVQLGGAHLDQQGARATPSLRYTLRNTPAWHQPYVASMGERIREGVESPSGGFGWDGRFNSLHEQAAFPLLAANEMANTSTAEVTQKLLAAPYAGDLKTLSGDGPQQILEAALHAIEEFELNDPSFHPFDSKFDDYLDGKTALTSAEARGFKLFNDPNKGNCASCHIVTKGQDGSHPLLTNFQYEALGVPRNAELAANHDQQYFDQGVCGPARADLHDDQRQCGMFKSPTLRNVASRGALFHNGYFHDLKSALQFYAQRDSNPAKWYPQRAGHVDKFNDLPKAGRDNVNMVDAPFNGGAGSKPVWNAQEIDDVIAFLKTLTDRDVKNR